MHGKMLTTADGPVVVSERTMAALVAIRRQSLLPKLFGQVVMARSNVQALGSALAAEPWLCMQQDRPDVELPPRTASVRPSDATALKLALGIGASLVLLEDPAKQSAKLSFIKAEGTIALLVRAHREGHLSAVQPMAKALAKLGHADVLPSPDQLEALWAALDELQ